MASSSINTCKITGFEIHTTNIRNPHKSTSFYFNSFGKNRVSSFKTPQTTGIKNIPLAWAAAKACMLAYVINLQKNSKVLVCLHKMCHANSQ